MISTTGLIYTRIPRNVTQGEIRIIITTAGYRQLDKILDPGQDSNSCFVAMWFADKMEKVFMDAIRPAIEYEEKGQSRFKAVKVDNIEHTNDINDEIISQIRRSKFMVCDLTGYRGGVYWEAGFAYGLGLEVIYTCRDDWVKEEPLKYLNGKPVTKLKDRKGNMIEVKKEGIHFDLEHRNRIEWNMNDLPAFKEKLESRIKSVII